ncbi:MAG: hypothetical protein Q8K32_11000 [Archangium sp.]|nr:hypothetical protein [Archangium sp.]
MAPKPITTNPTPIRTKHIDTVRNGNDDYTTTEYLLEGDGKTWRTVGSRVIAANRSRSLTLDYLRDWWIERVGRNGVGDFD